MTRHALEMRKRGTLIHVVPLEDGSFLGDDIYQTKNNKLRFRNYEHLRNFATKYGYTVTRIRNT